MLTVTPDLIIRDIHYAVRLRALLTLKGRNQVLRTGEAEGIYTAQGIDAAEAVLITTVRLIDVTLYV